MKNIILLNQVIWKIVMYYIMCIHLIALKWMQGDFIVQHINRKALCKVHGFDSSWYWFENKFEEENMIRCLPNQQHKICQKKTQSLNVEKFSTLIITLFLRKPEEFFFSIFTGFLKTIIQTNALIYCMHLRFMTWIFQSSTQESEHIADFIRLQLPELIG